MIIETIENGIYKAIDAEKNNKVLLTIISLGNNIYRAINGFADITAKIVPLDDYRTELTCIEYKRADKNGRYRKTTTLLSHTMSWLDYILEETGFIRKKKMC